MRFRRLSSVAALALGGGLVLASGIAVGQTIPQFDSAKHVGVASCAGSTCHGAIEASQGSNVKQNEYVIWSQKDRHSKAYKVLLEERSQRIARNLGLPNANTADICLSCHANDIPQERRGPQFQISDGVGCEACHGGASGWLGIHISGGNHKGNLAAGLYPTDDPVARAKLCLSCHVGSQAGKFVTHRIMGAGHPRISFELDTFTAIQPAHYVVDKDYVERKGQPNGVKLWAIGQAVQLQELMEAYLDPKRNAEGLFPELVFYDCHACHHPMSNLRWEPRASTGLGPGVVKFNDANALMLRIAAERVDPPAGRSLGEKMLAFHKAASTEGRAKALEVAAQVRDIAKGLVDKFAAYPFAREDIRALATGVLNDGIAKRDFIEYAGAEQATMAMGSIIAAMKNTGMLTDQQYATVNAALKKCYDATEKDEQYKGATFAAALKDLSSAIPQSTN
jgi:Cytochrome c554 and c-prime